MQAILKEIEVSDFLAKHSSKKIYFLKTDIKGFYDTIDLNTLYAKLEPVIDVNILQLVKSVINTVTLPSDLPKTSLRQQPRLTGIPQGLAISNILAAIYMIDFDKSIKISCSPETIYKRYVDDILILSLSTINEDYVNQFKRRLIQESVSLQLSPNKTQFGIIGDKYIDYIGYNVISTSIISIRPKNVQIY